MRFDSRTGWNCESESDRNRGEVEKELAFGIGIWLGSDTGVSLFKFALFGGLVEAPGLAWDGEGIGRIMVTFEFSDIECTRN